MALIRAMNTAITGLRAEQNRISVIGDNLANSTTTGFKAGLVEFERERFDVVFSDLGMPEVNGWDLALAVKRQQPSTRVVLVTGWGAQLEGGAAQARGVDCVISKPFSLEDIEQAIRAVAA